MHNISTKHSSAPHQIPQGIYCYLIKSNTNFRNLHHTISLSLSLSLSGFTLPELNIMPKQSITCAFVFWHFDQINNFGYKTFSLQTKMSLIYVMTGTALNAGTYHVYVSVLTSQVKWSFSIQGLFVHGGPFQQQSLHRFGSTLPSRVV